MLPMNNDPWEGGDNMPANLQPIENGDNLPPEVNDWVKSCFARRDELPDNDDEWQTLKSALLDTLPSQPIDLFAELGSSSINGSLDETHDELNLRPSTSGNSSEAPSHPHWNLGELSANNDTISYAHTENSSNVSAPVLQNNLIDEEEDIGEDDEELLKVSREQGKTRLKFRGNEYILLNFPEGEDDQYENEAVTFPEENVDSLENIFRVWELEIPDEEDELTRQLDEASGKNISGEVDALADVLSGLSLDSLLYDVHA